MAVSFDGPTLTITLESGVTSVEWTTVYSDWKRWVQDGGGHAYPPAFRPDGGSPLSAVIDQGRYYFLQNNLGWRIKPPEEDITIQALGNLALEDADLPSILPTTGAFTAAILGLQPITQGVIPSMRTNLEFNTFQGAVCIDMANRTGNAIAGTGYSGDDRIGTRRAPCDNPEDALTIANREGLHQFIIVSDFDGAGYNTDFSDGFAFIGDSPFIDFDMTSSLSMNNCDIHNLKVGGESDGVNLLESCTINVVSGFNGTMRSCELDGTIAVNGSCRILDCFSARTGLGYSTITGIASFNVQIRNLRGSIGLEDMVGGNHSIGIGGEGRLIIEASCTGGNIFGRGQPYDVDNLGTATYVDQTESKKNTRMYQRMGLEVGLDVINNVDGSYTFDDVVVGASIDGSGNVTHNRSA